MKCIICKEERNESDEHIIPEASVYKGYKQD